MNKVWSIRPAQGPDSPAIAQLFTRSFALLDFLPKLHTPEEHRKFFARVVRDQTVHVALDGTDIAGFISETEEWVNHLYIDPDKLRQGAGSALLKGAQSRQDHLQLWCFQKNGSGRAFYEAHGFIAKEFTDGSHNEEKEPDILYEWRIP